MAKANPTMDFPARFQRSGERDIFLAFFALAAIVATNQTACHRPPTPRRAEHAGDLPSMVPVTNGIDPAQPDRTKDRPTDTTEPAPTGDECTIEHRVRIADGWTLRSFRPGPALREIRPAGRHRLVGLTRNRVCTSDDGGEHWIERWHRSRSDNDNFHGTLALAPIDEDNHWLLTVQQTRNPTVGASMEQVLISIDGAAERWNPLPLPRETEWNTVRTVFTDGLGRVFVATDRLLFESSDFGTTWSSARTLPGRESREVAACGRLLVARARIDDDWFYHRSLDRGVTWRPFRLGAIGLEADTAMLRCLPGTGGLEVGRPPLPSYWSFDGGRVWSPAGYDARAIRLARTLAEDDHPENFFSPRCIKGPGHTIACIDPGRVRLLSHSGRAEEIHAPSNCEYILPMDHRRMVAFGPSCGLYVSTDRGGWWRMVAQSLAQRTRSVPAEGRGGFVDARTAWRLDGGLWWTHGTHWRLVHSSLGRSLERGVFVDARHGVFSTVDGWVVATRDGGRTWTYVLRGEVERIASSGRYVLVTTAQTVRVSPDGGVTWLRVGALPPSSPLDPVVQIHGTERSIALGSGVRIVQRDGTIVLHTPGSAAVTVVQGLPPGYHILAVHAPGRTVDRILLEGGAILERN